MSKVICIPCLNLRTPFKYVIHRHSRAKCSVCGKNRQGLLISITDWDKKCTYLEGCEHVTLEWKCNQKTCPYED